LCWEFGGFTVTLAIFYLGTVQLTPLHEALFGRSNFLQRRRPDFFE
jgi:hypothetical protein